MRSWFVFAALAAAALAPAPGSAAGFCTAQWAPVCAVKDGVQKTYSNVGCAKADGAEVVGQGQCGEAAPKPTPTPIFCTENYDPVCGSKDGAAKTYSNACFAKADGATVTAAGECPKP
jgi:sugar lactone lactonase YvrE